MRWKRASVILAMSNIISMALNLDAYSSLHKLHQIMNLLLNQQPYFCCQGLVGGFCLFVCVFHLFFSFRCWWAEFSAPLGAPGQSPDGLKSGVIKPSHSLQLAARTLFVLSYSLFYVILVIKCFVKLCIYLSRLPLVQTSSQSMIAVHPACEHWLLIN